MIRTIVLFLAFILTVSILTPAQDQFAKPAVSPAVIDWVPFVAKDCGFTASFPGTPAESTQSGKETTTRIFSVDAKPDYYAVRYTKYRDPVVDKKAVADMLNNMRTQIVANSKGKLIDERQIDINGWAGRELKIAVGESTLTTRVYWVKQQLYQVIASTPDAVKNKENIAKFFGSFSLKEKNYQSSNIAPDQNVSQ